MGLFEREFIATPDAKKGQIVFKHPDHEIRKFTKATVNADQTAMFVNRGIVIGEMGPGQHKIDADELPFLGAIIDNVIGKNVYKAELYFISTREFVDEPFGGRIDDVQDPSTGLFVSLRVFGEYSFRVTKPAMVVTKLVGTVDCSDNEHITDWIDQLLLKTLKTDVVRNITRNNWPVMGLSAYIPEIEKAAIESTNVELADYGLTLVRMGNFDINLNDADLARVKELAKDHAYTRLAGSYTAAAQAEMMKGMGEGAANFGPGTAGAFLATGLGASAMQQQAPIAAAPAGVGFAGATQQGAPCGSCQTVNAAGAKFCSGCGGSLAPPTVACTNCGHQNSGGAKFCAECGTTTTPQAVHCTSCGTEVAGGAKFCPDCGTSVAK